MHTLKPLLPQFFVDHVRELTGKKISFTGDFRSWTEAEAASTGYSAKDILDQTIKAARRVRCGEAAFERDGVAFRTMEHNVPLDWALKRIADHYGRLHLIDFGGSLGSTYYQMRATRGSLGDVKWAVIEQPAHVDVGTREFANRELSFHTTIEEAFKSGQFEVLLLSGVLQYLRDPFHVVECLLDRKMPAIILDRTPFMVGDTRRLTVQHVPKGVYSASYPAWFFAETELLSKFVQSYNRVATWPALDKHHPDGGRAEYKGFLFELKKPS
jgi:putative methyltransferase (TIGR04325 family)